MNIIVEIAQESDEWDNVPYVDESLFSELVSIVLSRYPNFLRVKALELSILLTGAKQMQSLNDKFRRKDKATNVLSFPDLEIDWRKIVEFIPDSDYMYLGDIAFGYEVIALEAKKKMISFQDHFKHLVIHAILHLIGYDHIKDEDAQVMESIEIQILEAIGINSPY
ncbi:MAG: rRNA maturation RNase YbeY [Rickettsiaceae bacterium]|nr:rRNA maturation RNase YbeY [Rickettsiaceae bacterium]